MKKTVRNCILVLLLLVLILIPVFDKNTYHHMILGQTLVNIVVVLGLNFITGLTGQMNLGTAGIMAFGAYTSSILSVKTGIPVLICMAAAIVVGYCIGWVLGYPSLRLKGVYLSLTTIGFSEIVRLICTNWVSLTGGTTGVQNIPVINLFGIKLDQTYKVYYFYLALVVILVFISYRIVHSKFGRVFKAIRDNVEAVEASGINIANLKIKAFTLAAIYGCFGGAMYAHLMGYINPTQFTQDLSANYLVMMVFGGIGTVSGCILGASTITILPEILRFLETYYWLVFSVITLIFVIFLPNGVVSLFRKGGLVYRWVHKKDDRGKV